MPAIAAVLPWVTAGIGAVSALSQGDAARKNANAAAVRDNLEAGQQQAAAQHNAQDVIRQSRLVQSRAQAVASSSGADASGPGVEKILSDLAAEGEYRVQSVIYGGDSRAAYYRDKAQTAIAEGRQAMNAGYINAAGSVAGAIGKSPTAMDQIGSFYDRFRTVDGGG